MSLADAFADIAGAFSAEFGAPYWPAQIVTPGEATYDKGGSILTPAVPTRQDCRAQVDVATEAMRQAEGFVEQDRRLLVLSAGLVGTITPSDRIEVLDGPFAGLWMIESVVRDGAAIGYELRGRRA